MNILFIAPRLPLPADTGGKIRTYHILKQLAKRSKIHLACFSFDEKDKELSGEIENDGIQVTLIPVKDPGYLKKVLQVLMDPLPVSVSKYYSEKMESVLTELNETNQFDAVHIDHLHMAHYRECFNGIPCVIDEHNVEFKILERCVNVEKSLIKRLVFSNQAQKMKNFEQKNIRNISAYFAVSQEDKSLLDDIGGNAHRGHVIPNGVDTQYFKAQGIGREAQEEAIVFTGSMDWLPNDDAAVYFCSDILPLIWKVNPKIKFYIVGKDPSAALTGIAKSDERIILTGRVDDVRVYVAKSKIFVVPLRIGGGTRLKILEAMSMQKAVVSTSIGAEGIDYTENENIILADTPEVFAQKVITLMGDEPQRVTLGGSGRELVIKKYDWNVIGKKLGVIYEQINIKK